MVASHGGWHLVNSVENSFLGFYKLIISEKHSHSTVILFITAGGSGTCMLRKSICHFSGNNCRFLYGNMLHLWISRCAFRILMWKFFLCQRGTGLLKAEPCLAYQSSKEMGCAELRSLSGSICELNIMPAHSPSRAKPLIITHIFFQSVGFFPYLTHPLEEAQLSRDDEHFPKRLGQLIDHDV